MMAFRDQRGHIIRLPDYPERIISLVPSLTELLFDLGLDEEIVGVTNFCCSPEGKVAQRAKIGGPKAFDFQAIERLDSDLAVGDKEENDREGILRLEKMTPVWVSDIRDLGDALEMIRGVGEIVNRREVAGRLAEEIQREFDALPIYPPLRAAYLIWKNPYMAAGGETFIGDMLGRCGFVNLFGDRPRYPEVSLEEVGEAEVILLSSEPYTFRSEDVDHIKRKCPASRVIRVDGTMFSWYGSRLKHAPAYFRALRESLEGGSYE